MCRWAVRRGALFFLFAAWVCPGPVFGGEGRLSLVGMGPGDPTWRPSGPWDGCGKPISSIP